MQQSKQSILIAGIDEAGRGPLAGPVVAAAVVFDQNTSISGLRDSKKLSERQREELFDVITQTAIAWAVAHADVQEIDQINILQASLLAMKRAFEKLTIRPDRVLVDGTFTPSINCEAEAIIKGDQKIAAISAASILAKVTRDREMKALDLQYPGYGFAKHKGYPTKNHLQCLHNLGPSSVHRRTFAPVKSLLTGKKEVKVQ